MKIEQPPWSSAPDERPRIAQAGVPTDGPLSVGWSVKSAKRTGTLGTRALNSPAPEGRSNPGQNFWEWAQNSAAIDCPAKAAL
jgi:hypothetical protein